MNIINQFIEIGITDDLPASQQFKTRLLNSLAIASICLIIPFFFLHTLINYNWLILFVTFFYLFASCLVLFTNYLKRYELSNYILGYVYTLCYVLTALYIGKENQAEYFFILPGIASGFLFDKNSQRIWLMLYCIFWFFSIKVFNQYYPNGIFNEPYLPYIHFFNGAIVIGVAFVVSNNILSNKEKLARDLRHKNEEITKLNETLEAKVAERTKEIEQKSKALAQSNQEIKSFSYIAAHDMREPLRNIISFTQLMNKDIVNHKYDKIDEYSGYIDWSVRRIDALTRDIVDYTNLEEKIKQSVDFDLNEVIYEAILVSFKRRKDAIFEVEALPTIHANKVIIQMLFKELIENAIQYCDKPQPLIKITYKESSLSHHFSVSDNGIGIDKEYHKKIFKMFKRLQNNIQQDGSGIGLSICKKIVDGYDGEIWVESEVGKGSTFHFTISKYVDRSKHVIMTK